MARSTRNYMGRDRKGRLDWVAFYYDPIEEVTMTFPGPGNGYSALGLVHYLYPQDPELGISLYETAMRQLGWSDPRVPVVQLAEDPQLLSTALWMSREFGDTVTWDRLREVAETTFEPLLFGEDGNRFGFWLRLDEPWPRGQINATMMMIECAEPGAWSRVFTAPRTGIHDEPTVRGLDYPNVGIRRTHHDAHRGVLEVDTVATTPALRGTPTSFGIDRLPSTDLLTIEIDGRRHERWRRTGHGTVEIDLPIDDARVRLSYR